MLLRLSIKKKSEFQELSICPLMAVMIVYIETIRILLNLLQQKISL
jgi:hypothetical protein